MSNGGRSRYSDFSAQKWFYPRWQRSVITVAGAAADPGGLLAADDFRSLCGKLAALEKSAEGAPLVSVAAGSQPTAREWQAQQEASEAVIALPGDDESAADTGAGVEEWEML